MSIGAVRGDDLSRYRSLSSIDVSRLPRQTAAMIDSDPQLRALVGRDHVIRDVPSLFARIDALDRAAPRAGTGPTSLSRADEMMRALRAQSKDEACASTQLGGSARTRPGIFGGLAFNVTAQPPSPEARVAAMGNDELLNLAETDRRQLDALANGMRQGPSTPERQAQLDRIARATFTPGAGLRLNGSARDQAAYLHMTREAMLESSSFSGLMNDISRDAAHPVTVNLERNTRTTVDSFARRTLDLSDLETLPAKPSADRPEQITRGEVLAHMMREQHEGALQTGARDIGPAHRAAIVSENAYRRDIGQASMRNMPPNDETRSSDEHGGMITIHFDDHHHEALIFDANGNLNGTGSYTDSGSSSGAVSSRSAGSAMGSRKRGS
jgi:hypothetical protein